MEKLIEWLNDTQLSLILKTTSWFVPFSQSIHILAVAVVLSAVLVISMRSVGVTARGERMKTLDLRFLPWFWTAVAVLLVTGILQIVTEPGRALPNLYFWLKMGSLVIVSAFFALFQRRLRRERPPEWDTAAKAPLRVQLGFLTVLALTLFIIFCGRWIAYSSSV